MRVRAPPCPKLNRFHSLMNGAFFVAPAYEWHQADHIPFGLVTTGDISGSRGHRWSCLPHSPASQVYQTRHTTENRLQLGRSTTYRLLLFEISNRTDVALVLARSATLPSKLVVMAPPTEGSPRHGIEHGLDTRHLTDPSRLFGSVRLADVRTLQNEVTG
jgi:hypothetical protein